MGAATAGGGFSLTRAVAGTSGVANNVAIATQMISGSGNVGITRQFGKFNIGVTGAVDRSVYGATTLTGGTVIDNSEQNAWALNAGLRVGFQITPIFEVFGRAGVGRDVFDLLVLSTWFQARCNDYCAGGRGHRALERYS
ncbi:MAG: outer membrane beta-barrel protein [Candidatus Devosia symbiotica]|nr:outer membrane beta-barrel protein [Candidatus Devosia symbiotica]